MYICLHIYVYDHIYIYVTLNCIPEGATGAIAGDEGEGNVVEYAPSDNICCIHTYKYINIYI